MKYFPTIIIGSVITIVIFMVFAWNSLDLSLSAQSVAQTTYNSVPNPDTASANQTELEEDNILWIDTIMYAKGHSFRNCGDDSMWVGWYLDTVCVSNDNMLQYDSIGPSTLKLRLVTRELTVDLGDSYVIDKIKDFLNPIDGFNRFYKRYEECLDSVVDEEYGIIKYMGGFSFQVDYAKSCHDDAERINRFICELTGLSESERAKVPALSAFYAGFNPNKHYRPIYTGNAGDMQCLSDFLTHKTFENWKREGEFGIGSSEAILAIRPHIANERYVTFSKYEYSRQGIGHGMYTETFHTLDLKNGKRLKNKDIFKSQYLNNVKMKLFEVMAKDPKYLKWHGSPLSSTDIEAMIEAWQSPNPDLEGTEWEEPERDFKFQLPEGALTDLGVIFSFQPYEIDCWAAGTYHFIVPYKKLKSYLTPNVKALID